jgi:hypothetical protein
MYYYKIYGQQICSDRQINLLSEQSEFSRVDVHINWQESTPQTIDNNPDWKEIHSETLELYTVITMWETQIEGICYSRVCFQLTDESTLSFVVDEQVENLTIYYNKNTTSGDLDSYLVGPAMGFIMRLKGIICLHSSAVEIDGQAIALLGFSTSGKSTTAAGLAAYGAKILADDITVLIPQNGQYMIQPGYSKVRLRPLAADFLTERPEDLPIVYTGRDSRYVALTENDNFLPKALPLSAIYVLGDFSDEYKIPSIEPINSQDKLITLLANTYGMYVVRDKLRANEFKVLAGIAKTIPINKLRYAHDISTLPVQCQLIIDNFRNLSEHRKSFSKVN